MSVRGNLKKISPPSMDFDIPNPKVYTDSNFSQESRIYPYYAGYAASFAESVITGLNPPKTAFVFDPWNGSGTTTAAAAKLGYKSLGQDLNPAMVLVSKANLLPASEANSLLVHATTVLKRSQCLEEYQLLQDPLSTWLTPSSAHVIRRIESEINRSFVCAAGYVELSEKRSLDCVSSLAALFYVALFRTVRKLLLSFIPSNPTWVKKPPTLRNRKRPSVDVIHQIFLNEVGSLSSRLFPLASGIGRSDQNSNIVLGNSECVALPDNTVDIVVTSPPYCTRIDYAVATSIELATLRITPQKFDALRRGLMGTATVPTRSESINYFLGKTCEQFLNRVYQHSSKASKTYYYKNHLQYFNSLYVSIKEISRILNEKGRAVIVVQDSYYKEIRNDVAQIVVEMAEFSGLSLLIKKDFLSSRSMVGINNRSKKYRKDKISVESVLLFNKK